MTFELKLVFVIVVLWAINEWGWDMLDRAIRSMIQRAKDFESATDDVKQVAEPLATIKYRGVRVIANPSYVREMKEEDMARLRSFTCRQLQWKDVGTNTEKIYDRRRRRTLSRAELQKLLFGLVSADEAFVWSIRHGG